MQEEELYHRCRIYATDINERALATAQARIYPLERMQAYSDNYHQAGGQLSLANYYRAHYQGAILAKDLQKSITFAHHNLVSDGVFGEMHLILCRNVLIYFRRSLQDRVLHLLRDSLLYNGFLCLGSKETLQFSTVADDFEVAVSGERIYQNKTWTGDTGSLQK